jgi:hypothetical protein
VWGRQRVGRVSRLEDKSVVGYAHPEIEGI